MSGPLVTLRFSVANPIGINATYARGMLIAGKRGLYMTEAGKAWKYRVATAALDAKTHKATHDDPWWPRDPWVPAHVTLSYQLFATRLDSDSIRKSCKDAMEGILYANDRVVDDGPAPLAIDDGGEPRVEIVVELWAVRSADEARAMREASEKARIARLRRKARAVA